MAFDVRGHCADMVLASAVQDLAASTGEPAWAIRDRVIESPAYAALYDFETGLWGAGPDYFAAFYRKCLASGKSASSAARRPPEETPSRT